VLDSSARFRGVCFFFRQPLLLVLLVTQLFVTLPDLLIVFRKVLRLAWGISVISLGVMTITRNRRRFLWRVRQKLILSYVFLGFVPVLLVLALAVASALILYIDVAGYMFHEGFSDIAENIQQAAEMTAADIQRNPSTASEALTSRSQNLASQYPSLSLAVIPLAESTPNGGTAHIVAGPWKHVTPPADAPAVAVASAQGFKGVIAVPARRASDGLGLVIRSVVPTRDHTRAVVGRFACRCAGGRGHRGPDKRPAWALCSVPIECDGPDHDLECPGSGHARDACSARPSGSSSAPGWQTACQSRRRSASTRRSRGCTSKWRRSESVRAIPTLSCCSSIVLGVLFLIVQAAALLMGWLLARSITVCGPRTLRRHRAHPERGVQPPHSHRLR
jgi:hypothetical protein